uniref:C2H2-type domain-containing protein n=1 Tax=Chrysotila carterae TaxID=13221 RepID=A0A7S4BUH4_CHRCT
MGRVHHAHMRECECAGKHTASIGKVRSGRASLPDAPKPRFACDFCRRIFDAAMALGSHQRYCDDGTWRCLLCECTFAETASKCHGPNGPRTLCVACSTRHRTSDASTAGRRPANAERPARAGTAAQDAGGSLLCDGCERVFDKPHALRERQRSLRPSPLHSGFSFACYSLPFGFLRCTSLTRARARVPLQTRNQTVVFACSFGTLVSFLFWCLRLGSPSH